MPGRLPERPAPGPVERLFPADYAHTFGGTRMGPLVVKHGFSTTASFFLSLSCYPFVRARDPAALSRLEKSTSHVRNQVKGVRFFAFFGTMASAAWPR
jgi:hypothetical protein